jgi:predicted Rdx family selenoprotein
MIPSAGGCFELTVGGKLLYSKRATHSFPDEAEMVRLVGETLGV